MVGLNVLLVVISRSPQFSWANQNISNLGAVSSAKELFNYGLIFTSVLSEIFVVESAKPMGHSLLDYGSNGIWSKIARKWTVQLLFNLSYPGAVR